MIIQNFSVSSLISEINNIKIEAESLPNYPLSFMNSLMNPFNNNTQLEERIINISIKLMNTGIMCLKSILNYDQYLFKYQSKFQKISEELNFYAYPIQTLQKRMQEEANMFNMSLQDQMMRQMVRQQQMMQLMNEQNKKQINIVFQDIEGKFTNITFYEDDTIEDLYKEYLAKAPLYGHYYYQVMFKYNGLSLAKNDKRTLRNYFGYVFNPVITVDFLNDK